MTLVGFKARNHTQQSALHGANDKVDDRATTPEVFGPLNERFGGFTIDVAAAAHNTKCERFYSIGDDGLAQSWAGEKVWCNPPFSNIGPWVEKAVNEIEADLVVMLLPANRTEQAWWQRHIEPHRDSGGRVSVEFLPGRMRFLIADDTEVKPNARPPFGCCLVIFRGAS